ncbi:class I SAM-dependent DNA methyltransferase [Acetanaerobacterium elongatum]|uniref:Methyltransferase domain-containing protein n=1 Tax=Acetanaerobacterium elongatum TaxID=258515 RepID=A0A1H0BBB4_9FIRM|nr:methyltransferase domain-containing protein [Acetanaerobacterium elongatum]SDN42901.1 Methyltransferase domain-containing protein [Acetanaerobacterium elongatum]
MSSYNAFAKYYDTLTQNVDYPARADYFNKLIQKFGNGGKLLLDLACGTGSLSREFAKKGYDVIGIDSSYEMLGCAMGNTSPELGIQYIRQTMQGLDLYGTIDACVCALDSINHITAKNVLQKGFSRVSLFLDPEGVFIFDVNTLYKQQVILANNTFVYDYENVYCVWQNTFSPESATTRIELDFFEYDTESGAYYRQEEAFEERAYSHEELAEMLDNAGLRIMACFEGDTMDSVKDNTQRAVYITKKK